MNSKFLTIAGILLVALVAFGAALIHTQNVATTVVTTATLGTSTPASQTNVSQGSTTTGGSMPHVSPQVTKKPSPAEPAHTTAIIIKNYMFGPQTVTIKKGTIVTWTNSDIAKHTVTADDASGPTSKFFGQGESYSYTFSKAGIYTYHCEPHPYMTATITVTE